MEAKDKQGSCWGKGTRKIFLCQEWTLTLYIFQVCSERLLKLWPAQYSWEGQGIGPYLFLVGGPGFSHLDTAVIFFSCSSVPPSSFFIFRSSLHLYLSFPFLFLHSSPFVFSSPFFHFSFFLSLILEMDTSLLPLRRGALEQ